MRLPDTFCTYTYAMKNKVLLYVPVESHAKGATLTQLTSHTLIVTKSKFLGIGTAFVLKTVLRFCYLIIANIRLHKNRKSNNINPIPQLAL